MPTQAWREANTERLREYRRGWYERNKEASKDRAAKTRKEYRQRNLDLMRRAKDRPCMDCCIKYPYYVMHFDHIGDDKDADVSRMAGVPVSVERLMAEIAKCEVVCANCHAIRTWTRMQSKGRDVTVA